MTDEATLASLTRPRARLRCADCGEMHLLTQRTRTLVTRNYRRGGKALSCRRRAECA